MGGNAFPELKTVRLDASEFHEFRLNLFEKLRELYPRRFAYIPAYSTKESFGDLDILYNKISPDEIHAALGHPPIFRNGPFTSFAVVLHDDHIDHSPNPKPRYFQVDFIRVNPEEMNSAYGYFSYNDLGNLMGRIAHRAGFKLGHKGLSYIVREKGNENHAVKEIVLTHDWETCLKFLGYDYNKWLKGFETLEDVFKYVAQNPLVSQKLFRLDQTNHAARVRDRKRKTYQEFLIWVGNTDNGVPFEEKISKEVLRKLFFTRACVQFPHFKKEYDQLQKALEDARFFKSRFNGNIVRDITGLGGKDLGGFINSFLHEWVRETLQMDPIVWAKLYDVIEICEQIELWWKRIQLHTDYLKKD